MTVSISAEVENEHNYVSPWESLPVPTWGQCPSDTHSVLGVEGKSPAPWVLGEPEGLGRANCIHLKYEFWGSQLNLQHSQDHIQLMMEEGIEGRFSSKPEQRLRTLEQSLLVA